MLRTVRPALAAAAALAVAAGAAAALAQENPSATARDPAGDAGAGFDLRRVELARGNDGRLRAEMNLNAPWDAASMRRGGDGPPTSLCMRLFTRRDPASQPPDYLVCVTPAAEGPALVGRVLRDRASAPPRVVARARVSRPDAFTVFVRFGQSAIGRPATVRFSGEASAAGDGCRAPLGCRDLAPDAPKTVRLRLHRTSASR